MYMYMYMCTCCKFLTTQRETFGVRAAARTRFGFHPSVQPPLRARPSIHPKLAPPPMEDLNLDQLTAAQTDAVARARDIYEDAGGVLDSMYEPFLVRFLLLHKWRPASAAKMLKATAKWRKAEGADTIRAKLIAAAADGSGESSSFGFAQFPYSQAMLQRVLLIPSVGYTKTGDVVNVVQIGSIDTAEWCEAMTDRDFGTFNLHLLEFYLYHCDRASVQTRRLVRNTVVFDCHGTAFKQLTFKVIRRVNQIAPLPDLYYPELVGVTFALNAPWVVYRLWSLIKGLLSRDLQSRIHISSPEAGAGGLDDFVHAPSLPRFMTGGQAKTLPGELVDSLGLTRIPSEDLQRLLIANREAIPLASGATVPGVALDTASVAAAAMTDDRNGRGGGYDC